MERGPVWNGSGFRVGQAPEDGDDTVKEGVGSGGVLRGDVAPGGGEDEGGADLGGAACGHAVKVEAVTPCAAPGSGACDIFRNAASGRGNEVNVG